jgi:glycosyltransferase involved in cell wall biosynthesis
MEVDKTNHYTLLCNENNSHHFDLSNTNFGKKIFIVKGKGIKRLLRSGLNKSNTLNLLKIGINKMDLDIVHFPFTTINPMKVFIPSVLTFHDLQHEYYPEFFSRKELVFRRKTYQASAVEATSIIAISEYTKKSLIEKYNIPPDKINVIYLSAGPDFKIINDAEKVERIRKKYHLKTPFMFYPAASWPHKNHKNLIEALRLITDRYRFKGQLILTGLKMHSHSEIMRKIETLQLEEKVRLLEYIPKDDLPCIYNLAKLMIFPSLFEGFGMPLIEAMACGCPIICSDVTSIPEVVGNAAMTFNPNSPEDIAEKLISVWDDDNKRSRMRSLGFERRKKFSWENTAKQTINIYNKVSSK